MATKYVSSDNLAYFYSKIKVSIDSKLDASKAYKHPNSGVTAGTYRSVTVNAQGHVTAGTNPTTLAGYGITDAAAKNHTHNYAGSSSAGGSANSAVKLATARAINGVNFDGTGNITITANPTPNQLTNQKLNDITTPGFYYAGGSNSVTNKPDGVDPFGMLVMKNASGYTEQILIDSNQKIYIRMYNASTWSNWSALYTTLNKPSKSDVGLGSVENKSSATIRGELTKANVTTALGYTPPTTNTTYSTGTSTYSGTTKLYSSTGSATDGAMTQAATTSALNGKANSSHTHQSSDIVSLDAGKLTGTISIDRLPAGALERCIVVADDTARKALTTAKAQVGDTVKVTSTGLMYMIVDDTKLNQDAGYVVYTAGSAASVPWSGVSGKPTTLGGYGITDAAAKNHSHNYAGSASAGGAAKSVANSLSIQLNGGTATTFNGSAGKSINITPGSIGAAASSHTHNYAGSSSAGGAATNVYGTLTNPSNATTYYIPFNSSASSGNKSLLLNDGLQYYTREGTTSAVGESWLGLGNSIASGTAGNKLGKIYMYGTSSGYTTIVPGNNSTESVTITLPSSGGTLSLNGHTHNYAGSSSAGGAANSVKTNLVVKLNGGSTEGTNLFTFNGSTAKTINITPSAIGAAASSHSHNYAGSTSAGGAAKSVANSIAIKLNGGGTEGTNLFTYNGSAGKTINITPGAIGAAASSHTHNYAGSGSSGGSANSAVKLATARTISLGGDLSGSASFDGSANITISASVTAMTNTEIDKLFA